MWHWLRNEKLRKSSALYMPIVLSALLHSLLVTLYMMVSYSEQATLFLTLKKDYFSAAIPGEEKTI